MIINFLIPTTGLTGGIKVIFEHANNLVKFRHQVNLIYPYVLHKDAKYIDRIVGVIKKIRRLCLKVIRQDKVKWFNLDSRIKILRIPNLSSNYIPEADVVIVTANETADWAIEYPASKGQKFYFIQDYEFWTRDKKKVDATFKMPLKKIVISTWLKEFVQEEFYEKVYGIVPNGVNLEVFYNHNKIFNKNKRILMMYHAFEKKGIKDGIEAYKIAKAKFSNIDLTLFGAYRPPRSILKIAEFHYKPSPDKLRELFSRSDIFIWPSRVEGFGIPPMEAMACKCAVISTDTGAIRDYATPGATAVVISPEKPEIMAQKLLELIENKGELKKISLAGNKKIQEFKWEESSRKLEKVLIENL